MEKEIEKDMEAKLGLRRSWQGSTIRAYSIRIR